MLRTNGRRAAEGISGRPHFLPRERHDQAEHREGLGLAKHRAERFAESGALQALRKVRDGDLAPLHERRAERHHARAHHELVPQRVELGRLVDGHVEPRELANGVRQLSNRLRVLGSKLEQVPLEALDVAVEDEGGTSFALDAHELVEVDDLESLERPYFLPQLVESGRGAGADEPVNAAVDGVAAPLPRRAHSTWKAVHLEDRGLVSVHLRVAAGAQSRHAAADDGDRLPSVAALPARHGVLLHESREPTEPPGQGQDEALRNRRASHAPCRSRRYSSSCYGFFSPVFSPTPTAANTSPSFPARASPVRDAKNALIAPWSPPPLDTLTSGTNGCWLAANA